MFQLNDDPHAVAVGLVPQVGDALQPLLLHLLGDGGDELALVHLVGQLGDDDTGAVILAVFPLMAGLENAPVPRQIGSTLSAIGIGLMNGATGFGLAAVARGHGMAFLLVLVVVATVLVKQSRDFTLVR